MLPANARPGLNAIRLATPNSLDAYMNRAPRTVTPVSEHTAMEESFFLGLRLNRGLDPEEMSADFGSGTIARFEPVLEECIRQELLEMAGKKIRLTSRGRLLSNEVFEKFISEEKLDALPAGV